MPTTAPLPGSILVTGAAGQLGSQVTNYLCNALRNGEIEKLRLVDIAPIDVTMTKVETMVASLAESDAARAAAKGMDAIIHLAGISTENEWRNLVPSNLAATAHLFDAAVENGVDRILFASSNHAVGLYPVDQRIDHTAPGLPDSRYGLTKLFGEELARLYARKTPVRGFCMRIGSCFPEATAERHMSTYQSFADFIRLVTVGLTADYRFEIVYGMSDIDEGYWDNSNAFRLGYRPADQPESFRADEIDQTRYAFQGGSYATDALPGLTLPLDQSRDSER